MLSVTNVRKWIEALRSGKYTQTRERLKDDVGYCCWGVACELWGGGEYRPIGGCSGSDQRFVFDSCQGDDTDYEGVPPDIVLTWLGMEAVNELTVAGRRGIHYGLIDCNDDLGLTFNQIADLIEAYMNGWDLNLEDPDRELYQQEFE